MNEKTLSSPTSALSRQTKANIAYTAWGTTAIMPFMIIGNHNPMVIAFCALGAVVAGGIIGGLKSALLTEKPSLKSCVTPTVWTTLATSAALAYTMGG